MKYCMTVPGSPVTWQRPMSGKGGRRYTAAKTRTFEAAVALVARATIPGVLEGPLEVEIVSVVARPKSLSRARDPDGLIPCPKRPDADNYAKAVLDGLAPIWVDDAQVCSLRVLKVYAEKGAEPRTEITIGAFQMEQ